MLLGAAIGGLFGFRGTSVVIVGQGFSNNLTQYDDFTAGAWFGDADLEPFSVVVKNFEVKFETGPVQRGAARLFRADVEVTDRPGEHAARRDARGQQAAEHRRHHRAPDRPRLRADGHGQGRRRQRRVLRAGGVPAAGRQLHLDRGDQGARRAARAAGLRGVLLPTAVLDSQRGPRSVFPDALNPALFLNAWSGPPKVETGGPENVYSLDTTGLTQMKDKNGQPVRLRPAASATGRRCPTARGRSRWTAGPAG